RHESHCGASQPRSRYYISVYVGLIIFALQHSLPLDAQRLFGELCRLLGRLIWLLPQCCGSAQLNLKNKNGFLSWIDGREPLFPCAQALANGCKDFDRKEVNRIAVAGVFDHATFQRDAFDIRRLVVEVGRKDGLPTWTSAEVILNHVTLF